MKYVSGCVVALTLVGCNNDLPTPTVNTKNELNHVEITDLVSKNTVALGGNLALDAVHTMVKRSLIEEGDNRVIAIFATDRLGRMRIDIFAEGERVFAESFDGQRGHQWSPKDGQTDASERGTIALSHTPQLPNHIFRLKDVVANGHQLEILGSESIDEIEYHVLKLTLSDGFENFLLIDSSNGRVTRTRNKRALHVDINDDEKDIETRMSDYRRVGDIMHPHRVVEVNMATGEVLVRLTLQAIELNKELPENYFSDLVQVIPEN